jgi:hypothetical protein
MTYRTRINYTATQKAEMWDRWQRGIQPPCYPLPFHRLGDEPNQKLSSLDKKSSEGM